MNDSITLDSISNLTGIARERLRYVVDQRIVPGRSVNGQLKFGSRGRGRPRRFEPFQAFAIACAALLLGAGLRRKVVRRCLKLVCLTPPSRFASCIARVPLHFAFESREAAVLEIGDMANVQLRGDECGDETPFDTGWRQAATGAVLADYEPLVTVAINLKRLRDCFANHR